MTAAGRSCDEKLKTSKSTHLMSLAKSPQFKPLHLLNPIFIHRNGLLVFIIETYHYRGSFGVDFDGAVFFMRDEIGEIKTLGTYP